MRANGETTLLPRLRANISALPRALASAAKYVLDSPEKVVHQTIRELASFSGSSEASIMRLCRMLDYSGYRDFKIALASELALRPVGDGVAADDGDHLRALAEAHAASVLSSAELIDAEHLAWVAEKLIAARRIEIYGAAVSGLVAEIFAYNLRRLGLNAFAYSDPNYALEVMDTLGGDDVAIAVSGSGATADTVRLAERVRTRGVHTIAMTGALGSALTRHADGVLVTLRRESPVTGGEIPASTAQLFVVDAVVGAVTLALVRRQAGSQHGVLGL